MAKLPGNLGIKLKPISSLPPEADPEIQKRFLENSKDSLINQSLAQETSKEPSQPKPAVVADAPAMPVSIPKNQTKTFPIVLSAEAHQTIATAARKEGKSIKDFILTAIYEKIERA